MSLIRKHVAVLQAWACLALVSFTRTMRYHRRVLPEYDVRPSVRPSVMLVYAGHISWATWNFITGIIR